MHVKYEKYFTLRELIQSVRDGGLQAGAYTNTDGVRAAVYIDGITFPDGEIIDFTKSFKIPVREVLPENMRLPATRVEYYDKPSGEIKSETGLNESIASIRYTWNKYLKDLAVVLKIYYRSDTGDVLVWDKDHGLQSGEIDLLPKGRVNHATD